MKDKVIYCDRCNSESVRVGPVITPKPERVSMAEWAAEPSLRPEPMVHYYTVTAAVCLACGHRVERRD